MSEAGGPGKVECQEEQRPSQRATARALTRRYFNAVVNLAPPNPRAVAFVRAGVCQFPCGVTRITATRPSGSAVYAPEEKGRLSLGSIIRYLEILAFIGSVLCRDFGNWVASQLCQGGRAAPTGDSPYLEFLEAKPRGIRSSSLPAERITHLSSARISRQPVLSAGSNYPLVALGDHEALL